MKILIGTPIHQCKDYCMERWLKNVAELQKQTPADLLLVDNSPSLDYITKIKKDCIKCGVANFKIEHLELDEKLNVVKRINIAQEVLRHAVLGNDYDAWFSWECDQIIPTNALNKLVKIMESGNFLMVVHNSWDRKSAATPNFDMGCTLITRKCLALKEVEPFSADHWQEDWLEFYILRNGGSFANVRGVINPIYHLNE